MFRLLGFSRFNCQLLLPFRITAQPVPRFLSPIAGSHLKRVNNVQNLIKNGQSNCLQPFHSSPVRRIPIPPLLWVLLKPISKLAALITGRGLRKWWKSLPPNKKQYFMEASKRNRWKISGVILLTSGIAIVYYYSHLEETPYTKRKRFIVFTPEKFKEIAEFEFQLQFELNKPHLLPANHPSCKRVANVANRILRANEDVKELHDKNWRILVINQDTENAFVLPNGQLFVFTGMLDLCENDDELGVILSHEMAHCILSHGAENLSYSQFLDVAVIVFVTAIWAIMPSDLTALIADWFFKRVIDILINLPYSRKLETEADEFGLRLAAKACFDIRESSAFWKKVKVRNEYMDQMKDIEWLSTHPSHETRVDHLNSIMDKNMEFRKSCGCPTLSCVDPRSLVDLLKETLQQKKNEKYADKNNIATLATTLES